MTAQLQTCLASGTLHLRIDHSVLPIEELCDFANRANPKRRFLFISKVLGKHYPVRPSRMREVHRMLAERIENAAEPVLLIGMAETAIALGHGVFDSLRDARGIQGVFMHSTRYGLSHPVAAHFEETHSHATGHIIYQPASPEHQRLLREARSIIVVDDELSTGNTAANLLAQLLEAAPQADSLCVACITNWLDDVRREELKARFAPRALQFASLLDGSFDFQPDLDFAFKPGHDATGNGALKDGIIVGNHGRFGVSEDLDYPYAQWSEGMRLEPQSRILVLGTGEFMYPPFLFAEWLEQQGYKVWYQSSTRSPIIKGAGIRHVMETRDNYGDGIPNFVYNLDLESYDRIIAGYETRDTVDGHNLPEQLYAARLEFF